MEGLGGGSNIDAGERDEQSSETIAPEEYV
jgi:hypothetical protein